MNRCMGCMQEKGTEDICPYCGLDERELGESTGTFLPPGSMLQQRYTVGVALGQGGFGVTYIGYDEILNTRVAIKEYYPGEMAQRMPESHTIQSYTQTEDEYQRGKERFLQEARTLAKFADHPCIVGVKDCFDANGTAYMVMEFLNGVDLKEYLNRSGGKVSIEDAIALLDPVMDALQAVHQENIIHRDISPDNIFITTDGRVRLIDFGAARQSMGGQKSLSIMLKPGYAPEEQYRSRGNQGPWTDVYALTATFYRMILGVVPPDSLERLSQDDMEIPMDLPPHIQSAIRLGMAVRAAERFSSVQQLQQALHGIAPQEQRRQKETAESPRQTSASGTRRDDPSGPVSASGGKARSVASSGSTVKPLTWLVVGITALVMIVVLLMVVFLVMGSKPGSGTEPAAVTSTAVPTAMPTEPPYVPPTFTEVTASGITRSTQTGRQYGPSLARDGDPATAWNVPGGPGQWLSISAATPQKIKGIRILNGYTKYSPDYQKWIYYANNRPKDITVSFSDGSSMSFTLADVFDQGNYQYQELDFGGMKETNVIKITINTIYKGNQWNDCCISEVQTY